MDAGKKDTCHPGSFDYLSEEDEETIEHPEKGLATKLTNIGSKRWVMSVGQPIYGADGKAIAYVCVEYSMTDIVTRRTRLLMNTTLGVIVLSLLFGVISLYISGGFLLAPIDRNAALEEENEGLMEVNRALAKKARGAQRIAALT